MPQGVEGKMPDGSILQQAVIVILEGFLLEVVTKLVGNYESLVGVLIPCPNLVLRLLKISTSAQDGVENCVVYYPALTSTSTLFCGTTICSCFVGMGGFLY